MYTLSVNKGMFFNDQSTRLGIISLDSEPDSLCGMSMSSSLKDVKSFGSKCIRDILNMRGGGD